MLRVLRCGGCCVRVQRQRMRGERSRRRQVERRRRAHHAHAVARHRVQRAVAIHHYHHRLATLYPATRLTIIRRVRKAVRRAPYVISPQSYQITAPSDYEIEGTDSAPIFAHTLIHSCVVVWYLLRLAAVAEIGYEYTNNNNWTRSQIRSSDAKPDSPYFIVTRQLINMQIYFETVYFASDI